MKFRRFLGGLLLCLGLMALFLALLATVLPMIDNDQIRLILSSLQTRSRSALVNALNQGLLFILHYNYPVLGGGAGAALLGFLLWRGAKSPQNETFYEGPPPAPRAYAVVEDEASDPMAGVDWRRPAHKPMLPVNPAPISPSSYTRPQPISVPSSAVLEAAPANPYRTYGQSAYAPPEPTLSARPPQAEPSLPPPAPEKPFSWLDSITAPAAVQPPQAATAYTTTETSVSPLQSPPPQASPKAPMEAQEAVSPLAPARVPAAAASPVAADQAAAATPAAFTAAAPASSAPASTPTSPLSAPEKLVVSLDPMELAPSDDPASDDTDTICGADAPCAFRKPALGAAAPLAGAPAPQSPSAPSRASLSPGSGPAPADSALQAASSGEDWPDASTVRIRSTVARSQRFSPRLAAPLPVEDDELPQPHYISQRIRSTIQKKS